LFVIQVFKPAVNFASSGNTNNEACTVSGVTGCLEQLFALIAKGLGWFHWQIILKQGYSAVAAFFLDSGAQFSGRLFSESKTLNHTSGDLGHGTFSYEGIQFAHDPNETLWRLSIYGDACFGGDIASPGEKASQIIAVTGANSQLQEFLDLFSGKRKN
jgi:hypothetical protein